MDLEALKELVGKPPVFTPPSNTGPRFAPDPDMAVRSSGFPPVEVIKATGQLDDDGHPVFTTTSLQEHNNRTQAPARAMAAFTPAAAQITPPLSASLPPAYPVQTSAPNGQGAAPPAVFVAPGPQPAQFAAAPRPVNNQAIALPPAEALQQLAISSVQNALAAIQMLETAQVIPAARGLSFRQRELLEEITRCLAKM